MTGECRTDAIISLTAPKLGVKAFVEAGGRHLLGGRFVPMYVYPLACPAPKYFSALTAFGVTPRHSALQRAGGKVSTELARLRLGWQAVCRHLSSPVMSGSVACALGGPLYPFALVCTMYQFAHATLHEVASTLWPNLFPRLLLLLSRGISHLSHVGRDGRARIGLDAVMEKADRRAASVNLLFGLGSQLGQSERCDQACLAGAWRDLRGYSGALHRALRLSRPRNCPRDLYREQEQEHRRRVVVRPRRRRACRPGPRLCQQPSRPARGRRRSRPRPGPTCASPTRSSCSPPSCRSSGKTSPRSSDRSTPRSTRSQSTTSAPRASMSGR